LKLSCEEWGRSFVRSYLGLIAILLIQQYFFYFPARDKCFCCLR